MMTKTFSLLASAMLLLSACAEDPPDAGVIGYVEADWHYIAAPSAGWIIERPVRAGAIITEDTLLFSLDRVTEEARLAEVRARVEQSGAEAQNMTTGARAAEIRALEARLSEARARLTHAQAERARILPLVARGVEQSARGDQVEADYQVAMAAARAAEEDIAVARLSTGRPAEQVAADAAVRRAQADEADAVYRLNQRTVLSASGGMVTETFYAPGEYVQAGAPVIALLPEDGLKVRFFVPQADLPALQLGTDLKVSADGLTSPVSAKISYIAPDAEFTPPVIYTRASREKLVFLVEADVPTGAGLHPGLPVEIDW